MKKRTKKVNYDNKNILTFKAYKKKALSGENGPDLVGYQAVQYRIKNGKNIRIVFEQGIKEGNISERELFLTSAISERIKKGLELLDKLEKGEIEIKQIKKTK